MEKDREQRDEWKPAGVHVGEVCTARPAPHASDGGIKKPAIGVSVVDESELGSSKATSKRAGTSETRKRYVRLPNVRARRRAQSEGRVHAIAVRAPTSSYVCLQQSEIADTDTSYEVKLFDAWTSIAKNISDASRWAAKPLLQDESECVHACEGGCGEGVQQERRQWDSAALPFVPSHVSDTAKKSREAARSQPTLVEQSTAHDKISRLHLRDLLKHKQVSHVRHASRDVRTQMDKFNTCSHATMQLDMRGTTASRIQKDLRAQLVEDLKEGSDEAAFVCKQLGIDSVPRADQLELMIAAMPGRMRLEFDGPPAKSGLNIDEWKAGHATHCKKGCTASKIKDECYFRVVHHFLLRGYDPVLDPGQTWDEFKKQYPAYVDVWRADEDRCRKAWEKWKENSADLLSEPVEEKPKFSVPILPASRTRYVCVWT